MNIVKTLIAAAVSFSAMGPALAQEADSDAWMNVHSSKTRAQVQAELARARSDGSMRALSVGYIATVSSSMTRAEVAAALNVALATGEFARLHAEAWQPAGQVRQVTDVLVAATR